MDPGVKDLIEQHQGYVAALARGIARKLPSHADIDELIGWGNVGLVQAAGRYSFGSGASFETFAYRRIRGAIFDGLRKMTGLPSNYRSEVRFQQSVDEISENMGGQAGGSDDPEELASQLKQQFRNLGVAFLLSRSSDDDTGPEGVDETSAAERAEHKEQMDRVRELSARLPEQEAALVRLHYFEGLSLTDTAARLGLHKSWVSRLHVRAIEALRKLLETPQPKPP